MKSLIRLLPVFTFVAATTLAQSNIPPAPTASPDPALRAQSVSDNSDRQEGELDATARDTLPSDRAKADHSRMRKHRVKVLTEKLSLTDAQQAQVKAIFEKADQQTHALGDNQAGSREKIRAIMQDTHAQVRAVLTPDQQKTFDAMPKERMGHRGPKPEGDKPADAPPPPPQS